METSITNINENNNNNIKPNDRIYSWEFLRIILNMNVILGHYFYHVRKIESFICHIISVELFFILSGFFLYRKLSKPNTNFWEYIKKTYRRLIVPYFTVFILTIACNLVSISKIGDVITLISGIGLHGVVINFGDWYVGVLFWLSVFFGYIITYFNKLAPLVAGIIFYIAIVANIRSISLSLVDGLVIRGLFGIGLGILIASFVDKIHFQKNILTRIIFTILEVTYLLYIIKTIFISPNWDLVKFEIRSSLFLISSYHSLGYLSSFLNRQSWVYYYSRYTYQILMVHAIPIKLMLQKGMWQNLPIPHQVFILLFISIAGAMVEYHLVENKLVPRLERWLGEEEK